MKHKPQTPSRRELMVLLAIYIIGFTVLAVGPYDRWDWALENFFPVSMLLADEGLRERLMTQARPQQ